jgi:hypothetical protein
MERGWTSFFNRQVRDLQLADNVLISLGLKAAKFTAKSLIYRLLTIGSQVRALVRPPGFQG